MILTNALRRWLPQKPERAVYEAIVAAARRPRLYEDFGVPDTVDGRFEMISVHLILVLRAVAGETGPHIERFRQDLIDELFRDMDRSLREMGTGDLSVGKKVRKMAEVFYGRLQAYTSALNGPEGALEAAFARNVWPDVQDPPGTTGLAAYVRQTALSLANQSARRISAGELQFGEPQ